MRFLRQSLTGLMLVAVTLGLLVVAGQMIYGAVQDRLAQEPRTPPQRERIFAVNVVRAVPEDVVPVLTAFGEIQSQRTLELRAAVGGRVVALSDAFEEGGRVRAGDILVQIDPADALSALERVRTDLDDSEAEAREARRALDLARDELVAAEEQAELRDRAFQRQSDLEERGFGTAAAVETAELAAASALQAVLSRRQAVAQAEARVDQSITRVARERIAMDEAQRRLDDTELQASFNGTLRNVAILEGGLVSPNERLADLVDANALEVEFRISTAQYVRLLDNEGQLRLAPVEVALDVLGSDLVATGRISRDSVGVGEGQTGRIIFARLDAARGMKPGDFVTVTVEEPLLERVVLLPATAINADAEVLVVSSEERLEAMQVDLLRRQGDDVLVRAPGLAGRDVVAERTPLLGAGIRVRPLRGEEASRVPEPEFLELSEERRARLVAFVEGNSRMPEDAKERILTALAQARVPAQMVARIEARMGG